MIMEMTKLTDGNLYKRSFTLETKDYYKTDEDRFTQLGNVLKNW